MQIGTDDKKGLNGCMTLADTRAKAVELPNLYKSGILDVRSHLEAEETARQATQESVVFIIKGRPEDA